jgi:hypothetical protein
MHAGRLLQVRREQVAAVAEGELQEGGRAAAAVMAAADGARAWSSGKGGAFFAPGASAQPFVRFDLMLASFRRGR